MPKAKKVTKYVAKQNIREGKIESTSNLRLYDYDSMKCFGSALAWLVSLKLWQHDLVS